MRYSTSVHSTDADDQAQRPDRRGLEAVIGEGEAAQNNNTAIGNHGKIAEIKKFADPHGSAPFHAIDVGTQAGPRAIMVGNCDFRKRGRCDGPEPARFSRVQDRRDIDRALFALGEREIGENVVEMLGHRRRGRARRRAAASASTKGDVLVVAACRGGAAAVEGDHQRRARNEAAQKLRQRAFAADGGDGDVEAAGEADRLLAVAAPQRLALLGEQARAGARCPPP